MTAQQAASGDPERDILEMKRLLAVRRAHDNLLPYIKLTMPHPDHRGDAEYSRYEDAAHHRMLCEAIERVERREVMRFANSIPPQHGKSTILSHRAPAWISGRHPDWNIIVATYSADFAQSIGNKVLQVLKSPAHNQVFPGYKLRRDSQSKTEMITGDDGSLIFVGRGEGTTGRPCDLFIIDDPLKDKVEADSPAIRQQLHDWYSSVVFSRCHVRTPIIIVHTRWHEDDLIGRQCDPEHPEYSAKRASRWVYINIPAEVKDPKLAAALNVPVGGALWPERFPLEHLAEARDNDPAVYSALYMGKPTPEEGDYFKADWLVPYRDISELPERLRKYGASDHALTEKERNDASVIGCAGMDESGDMWILPDLFWERVKTDVMVDEMLQKMRDHDPEVWWAAKDHISGAIGPFLEIRQREEKVWTYVEAVPERKEITTRARSIQGQMQKRRVHFPVFAPWWPNARAELLKFPNATHDDFVSFMAILGLGLAKQFSARREPAPEKVVSVGSLEWVKAAAKREQRETRIIKEHARR